ncbi:MAG: non-canonical purine NTP pyrophosphatase [Candidatus Levybacteria bacterium]|nr:non-canonical purine NTP pyrophosphatase [Candidatus Levybacteria bacterium]
MTELTFITGNKHKLQSFYKYCNVPVTHVELDLSEIQSLDVNTIVEHKAKEAFRIIKKPVLIEDVSLTFHALGKLPGPLVKWFLEEIGNEGLCRLLHTYKDKSATASVTYGLYDGKELHLFYGEAKGTIAEQPMGTNDFGWTPIFIPEGYHITWGQMNLEDQGKTSMRKKALMKLEKFLQDNEK